MLPKGWIQCRFSVLLGERKASISSAKYGTPGIRTSDSKQWTGPAKNTCLWARESTVFRLAKSVTYKQRAAEVFWASAAGRSGECLMIGCGLSRPTLISPTSRASQVTKSKYCPNPGWSWPDTCPILPFFRPYASILIHGPGMVCGNSA